MASVPTWRGLLLLTSGAIALLLAVFLVPFHLASAWPGGYPDVAALSDQMSVAFVHYWHTGTASDLAGPVDYWARFHLLKALLTVLLLMVLIPLGGRIWSAYRHTARPARRLVIGVAGVVHATATGLAVVVLVANIQGAIAPLSSALGLMPLGGPDPALASTVGQVRHALATGQQSAALDALVRDYARYHAALAAVGVVVTVVLLTVGVRMWRRRGRVDRAERRYRRVLLAGSVGILLFAAFFGMITAANLATAAHPAPALLGFFNGSF